MKFETCYMRCLLKLRYQLQIICQSKVFIDFFLKLSELDIANKKIIKKKIQLFQKSLEFLLNLVSKHEYQFYNSSLRNFDYSLRCRDENLMFHDSDKLT